MCANDVHIEYVSQNEITIHRMNFVKKKNCRK